MAKSDGSIIIDTKIDMTGIEKGTKSLASQAATLAAAYRQAGASQSEAMTKAWSEIERASSSGAASVTNDVEKMADSIGNASRGKIDFSGFNEGFEKVAKGVAKVAAAVGAALSAAAAWSIKLGSEFYAAMSEVEATSGATADEMVALTEKAKEMGATTKYSAKESADALKFMAQAGWSAEQMISGLPGVMHLAAASGEDLASVSSIVTDSLFAMGLKASDSAHFADVLAVAAAASNTSVGLMGDTFRYAAPLAGALGFSIEDVSVAIGLMANAGIKGDQAGTALRAILTRLAKPTSDSAEAMKKLGLEITDADGKMRPLNDILVDMRAGFEGMTEAEQASYAAMLGGQEALSGLLALVNASDDDFAILTQAIADADGAAQTMAETMQDNLAGDMEELGGALETLGIQVFEAFDTPLRDAVQAAQGTIGQIATAMEAPEMQAALTKIGAAVSSGVEAIALFLADVLPGAVLAIAGLIENFDGIAEIVGVVALAFVGFKTGLAIQGTITAVTTAMTVLATSAGATGTTLTLFQVIVGLVTGKISIMNAIMMASPWGIALAAVGALAAGIVILNKRIQEANADVREFNEWLAKTEEETLRLSQETRENSDSYDAQKVAFEENREEVKELMGQLAQMRGEGERTAVQQQDMAAVVKKLNELVPELNLALNEQTGALNMTARETEALIAIEQTRAEKVAAEDQRTAVLEKQAEVLAQIAEIEAEIAGMQDDLAAFPSLEEVPANSFDIAFLTDAIAEAQAKLTPLYDLLAIQAAELERAEDNVRQSTEENIQAQEAQIAIYEEKIAAIQAVNDEYAPLLESTEKLIEKTDEMVESIGDSEEAFQDAQRAIEDEAALLKTIAQDTEDLANATNRTSEEEARLAQNIDTLNDYFPLLNLSIDEQTGKLSASADEIGKWADAWAEGMKEASAAERITAILEEQVGVTGQLALVEASLTDVRAAKAKASEQLNATDLEAVEVRKALSDTITQLTLDESKLAGFQDILVTKNTELNGSYQTAAEVRKAALDVIAEAEAKGVITKEQAVEAIKKLEEEATKEAEKHAEEQASALAKANEKMAQYMSQAYERYVGQVNNLSGKLEVDTKLTLSKVISNLQNNTALMERWVAGIGALAERGVDEGVLKYIRDLGVEGTKVVEGLIQDIDKGGTKLQQLETLLASGELSATKASTFGAEEYAQQILDELGMGLEASEAFVESANTMINNALGSVKNAITAKAADAQQAGKDLVKQIEDGVTGAAAEGGEAAGEGASEVGAKLVDGMIESAKAAVTEKDSDLQQIGKDIDAAIAAGVLGGGEGAEEGAGGTESQTAIQALIENVKTDADAEVEAQDFPSTGTEIDRLTAQGIKSGTDTQTAARDMVANAKQSTQAEVGYSDFPGVGMSIPQGMAQGVRSGTGELVSAVQEMVRQSLEAGRRALDSHSPSRKFQELGVNSTEGYLLPFKEGVQEAARTVGDYLTGMYQAAQGYVERASWTGGAAQAMVQGAEAGGDFVLQGDIHIKTDKLESEEDARGVMRAISSEYSRLARYRGVLIHGTT